MFRRTATLAPQEVTDYRLGSAVSGGNSVPDDEPYADPDSRREAADEYCSVQRYRRRVSSNTCPITVFSKWKLLYTGRLSSFASFCGTKQFRIPRNIHKLAHLARHVVYSGKCENITNLSSDHVCRITYCYYGYNLCFGGSGDDDSGSRAFYSEDTCGQD